MAMANRFEKEYVMFLVGRMNPPTPGHIRGLCVPFLRALREFCLKILGSDYSDFKLAELAKLASVAPRLFLTNSTNDKRISYLSGAKAALYDNVKQIVKEKTSPKEMEQGIFYVKDKQLENPLIPEDKKIYVVEMLGNELAIPENRDIMVPKEILNMWIVCQTLGIESWCASRGPASAIDCALMLSKSKKYNKVFFFMGVDEDPLEMTRRSKFCLDSPIENEEGAKVNCIRLERINTVNQEQAADAAESIADGSMSASKIRLLCARGDVATLQQLYSGLLTDTAVNSLIIQVREGLRLPPMSDIGSAAPPPRPQRLSARLADMMPGPSMPDTTSNARRSGWTRQQMTPGANAIGVKGFRRLQEAEEGEPTGEREGEGTGEGVGEKAKGGRKTKRSRSKKRQLSKAKTTRSKKSKVNTKGRKKNKTRVKRKVARTTRAHRSR